MTEVSQQFPRIRNTVAPAIQRMVEAAVLKPSQRILCYGCGRGADVSWLKTRKFQVEGYDPHPPFAFDTLPQGKYDSVLLVYLLPRLQSDENRRNVLHKAFQYVRPGGQLILVSRNAPRLAKEAGHDTPEGTMAYLQALFPEEADQIAPLPLRDDDAICVSGKKGGLYQPKIPIEWIDTYGEMSMACHQLATEKIIALDVETTLEVPRTLCTIQLGVRSRSWIIDALAMDDLLPVKALMEDPEIVKIIHNASFEEEMLGKHDIRIRNIFDTLPTSRKKHRKTEVIGGHKLGEVCERELDIYLDKALQTSDWTTRPLSPEQLHYAALDVEVLLDLYDVFNPPPPPENLELF